MSQEQLQAARQLITEGQYDEAKAILRKLRGNPTAEKWLEKLDEVAPANDAIEPEQSSASKGSGCTNILLSGIFAALALILGIAAYDTFIATDSTSEDDVQVDETANEAANATTFEMVTWEYLTVQYLQNEFGPSLGEDEETIYVLAEKVSSSDPEYDLYLFGELICNYMNSLEREYIGLLRYDEEYDLKTFMQEYEADCGEKFRGLGYYLDLWGADRWELVDMVDRSTADEYAIGLVFKRPRL